MKKEDVFGLLMYLVIFAVALIFGLSILQPHFAKSSFSLGIIYALFILGALVTSIVICALLFELGHVLGAKVGRYTILSVCVLGFKLLKDDNKWKFKFSGYDGLLGETKILPKDEKSSPRPYLLFGTFFAIAFGILSIVLFYINKDYAGFRGDVGYFFLTCAVVAFICVLYNIAPFKLDSLNDGYRLAMVSNPKNKEAFNELLRVEHEIALGNENVEIKTFTELTNFTASLNMNKVYLALDKEQYDEALELIDIVLNNEKTVSRKVYLRAIAMKVYLIFVSKGKEEGLKHVETSINNELRREISGDTHSLVSIRAYLLIAGLADKSKSECLLVLSKAYKAYKATPKERRVVESGYFNKVIDMLCETHPKWEFENYKIVVEEKQKGSK